MKKSYSKLHIVSVLIMILVLGLDQNLFAQTDGVSIDYSGSPTREPKAILQLNSTEQGFILPRMTAAQRVAISPPASAQGMTVYQTDATEGYYYWDGTQWLLLSASTGGGYIENRTVDNAFGTGQAASYDITGNAEIGGTLEVSGSVGIGTTSPDVKLDVETAGYGLPATTGSSQTYAGIRISPPSSSGNVVLDMGTGGGTNGAWLQTTLRTTLGNTYPLLLNPNGGNVGVGTLIPDEKLHVEGEALFDLYQQGDGAGIFFRQGFSSSNKYNLGLLLHDDGDSSPDALDIAAFDGIYLNTGSNSRTPRLVVDQAGAIHIGPRASNDVNGRAILMERTAPSNGEASGRIMFTEHNSTSASADLYGFSIQYSGNGVGSTFPSGATTLLGNAGWGFVGHDNDLDGELIMSGFRNTPNVQFYGSIDLANGVAVNEFSTDGTMGGNSNAAVPTEAAVVTYVNSQVSGADEWTLSGTDLYPNSTTYDVGIGNTNPGYKLEVTGTGKFTGTLNTATPTINAAVTDLGYDAPIAVPQVNTGSGGFVPMIQATTLITSGYRKHINIGSYRTGSAWGGGIYLAQGGNDNYPTEYFLLGYGGTINHSSGVITTTDQVGIGTTAPAYELDVVGDVRAGNNLYVGTGGGYFYNDSGSRVRINQDFYTNNANTYLYGNNTYLGNSSGDAIHLRLNYFDWTGGNGGIINTNGRVGIGTTAPAYLLEIEGGSLGADPDLMRIGTSNGDVPLVFEQTSETSAWTIGLADGHAPNGQEAFVISRGTTFTDPKVVVEPGGDVGIGLTNPTYRLHVNGAIRTLAINETSDARMKKDITSLSNSLEKVLEMRGVTYNWRQEEFPETDFEDGLQYGLIAQELEKIIPELVDTDAEGWKSIEYSHLVPLLIEAIKDQHKIIEQQSDNMTVVNTRLDHLTSMVESLQHERTKEAVTTAASK